jgi:hypothetical protein
MVMVLPSREVIVLTDKRKPEVAAAPCAGWYFYPCYHPHAPVFECVFQKPRAVRQSECMIQLNTLRASFYRLGPTDPGTRAQEQELGDSFAYVKSVRCDLGAEECKGIEAPAWKINGTMYPVRAPGFSRCATFLQIPTSFLSSESSPFQGTLTLDRLEQIVSGKK